MSKETALLSFTEIALLLRRLQSGGQNSYQGVPVLETLRTALHPRPGALPIVNYTSTATQEAEFPLHLRNDLIIKAY